MSELDTAELLEEHNGKLYLPGYLDTIFTPDEKRALQEMTHLNQGATIRDYPRASAFLIEHDQKIHSNIPEEVFQESHETNYRRYLASHMGIRNGD